MAADTGAGEETLNPNSSNLDIISSGEAEGNSSPNGGREVGGGGDESVLHPAEVGAPADLSCEGREKAKSAN